MANNTIFKFADKFGIESPFGNWLQDKKYSEIPSIKSIYVVVNHNAIELMKGKILETPKEEIKNRKRKTQYGYYLNNLKQRVVPFFLMIEVGGLPSQIEVEYLGKKYSPNLFGSSTYRLPVNLTFYESKQFQEVSFKVSLFDQNNKKTDAQVYSFRVFFDGKLNTSSCICQKLFFTAEELNYVVSQIRKLDTRKLQINPRDKNGNRTWVDDNRVVYDSNDRGKPPKKDLKRNIVTKELSVYADEISGTKDGINKDWLFFFKKKEKLSKNETNYNTFVKFLNQVFRRYEIDTCLRKIHFLGQAYQETDLFRTFYEENPSSSVRGGDFYRGRGLKQITHDYNYLEYYDFVHNTKFYKHYMRYRTGSSETIKSFKNRTGEKYISTKNYDAFIAFVPKLATDMFHACNAAGWYWQKVGINKYADADDVRAVSALVNNPSARINANYTVNGLERRRKYTDLFKIIFDYGNCE